MCVCEREREREREGEKDSLNCVLSFIYFLPFFKLFILPFSLLCSSPSLSFPVCGPPQGFGALTSSSDCVVCVYVCSCVCVCVCVCVSAPPLPRCFVS